MSVTVYATRADYPKFGTMASALAKVPTDVQDDALAAASELLDSYLRSYYVLPLMSAGRDMARATVIVATYDVMVVRGYGPNDGENLEYRRRYEDVIAWAKEIGKSIYPNVVDSSGSTTPGGTDEVGGGDVQSSSQRGWSSRGTDDRGPYVGD